LIHWNLDRNKFNNWAIDKITDIVISEQIEAFCEKSPPQELLHLYEVVDEKVIPLLQLEGIPITKLEIRKIFRQWFIEQRLPTKLKQPDKTTEDGAIPKIKGKSKLNYNFSKFTNGNT
jgi:predicted DNA-binding transcriptional regulator YafY